MNIVVSCHLDTVFKDPFVRIRDGISTGANDNIAGVMAAAQLIEEPDLQIELTEDEEMYMDGARYVAKKHKQEDTFIIILEVTRRQPGKVWDKINFTIENWSGIPPKLLKKILKDMRNKYKLIENGEESEAWLYKELGFSCVEVGIPVQGGPHSLDSRVRVCDIMESSRAVRAIANFIKSKTRSEISDIYRVDNAT